METLIGVGVVVVLVIFVIAKTAIVVPQQSAYVIENLGKYSRTIQAGFHILVPFVERVAYRHSLKERAVDIPEQVCITQGQRAGGRGRRALPPGARPAARVVRHRQLRVRDLPARPDHAAQRDGQDRARPHLRGARRDQRLDRVGARQGLGALGREGAALRDQEHQPARRT